MTNYINNK